jgi:hypothetical protein
MFVPMFSLTSVQEKQEQHSMKCEINWLHNFYLTLLLIQSMKSITIPQKNILVQYRHCQFPLFKLLQTSILPAMVFIMDYKEGHKPKKESPVY